MANATEYDGPPWAGETSAGTSATHALTTAAADPDEGTDVNGFTPASFTAASLMSLVGDYDMTELVTVSAYWMLAVIKITSAGAAAAAEYNNPGIIASNAAGDARIWMGFSNSGVHVGHEETPGGSYKGGALACSKNAWHVVQGRFAGGNIQAKVDGGAWTTLDTAGNVVDLTGTLRIFRNWGNVYANGDALAFMTAASMSDGNSQSLHEYFQARYAL